MTMSPWSDSLQRRGPKDLAVVLTWPRGTGRSAPEVREAEFEFHENHSHLFQLMNHMTISTDVHGCQAIASDFLSSPEGKRMTDVGPAGPRTLAEKIDRLFRSVHPAQGEYTHEEVASAIRKAGGPTISATYLWQLRKGVRKNPTMRHLEALSEFFGVPPAYFFDDEVSARIDAELSLLASFRDASVRQVALRASGLSPESIQAIVEMIERVRKLEGLSEPNGVHHDEEGSSRED